MGFSRSVTPARLPSSSELTAAMVGIGMAFAAPAAEDPNIEDTLLHASTDGMDRGDLRVLAVLVTWFGVHHPWVNADRLTRSVSSGASPRVCAFWSALAAWQTKDRRFERLARLHRGGRVDLLATGTDFQIRRHGEDQRFVGTCLRLPANLLRDRPADVLPPSELARRHNAYRCRIQMGPSYRADVWAALEAAPTLSTAELARRAYASFATAWQVRRDFATLTPRRHR